MMLRLGNANRPAPKARLARALAALAPSVIALSLATGFAPAGSLPSRKRGFMIAPTFGSFLSGMRCSLKTVAISEPTNFFSS